MQSTETLLLLSTPRTISPFDQTLQIVLSQVPQCNLSVEELKRLGRVLDRTDDTQAADAVRLLLFTGARSSEITGLRWEWIRGTRAVLPDSKTGPKTIQLPPPARAVIGSLPRGGEFVFPHPGGSGPLRDLGRRWSKLRAFAKLDDVRLHDLRHTAASQAVMAGENLPLVGKLLGHRRHRTTAGYAHLDDKHLIEVADHIGTIIAKAMANVSIGIEYCPRGKNESD